MLEDEWPRRLWVMAEARAARYSRLEWAKWWGQWERLRRAWEHTDPDAYELVSILLAYLDILRPISQEEIEYYVDPYVE